MSGVTVITPPAAKEGNRHVRWLAIPTTLLRTSLTQQIFNITRFRIVSVARYHRSRRQTGTVSGSAISIVTCTVGRWVNGRTVSLDWKLSFLDRKSVTLDRATIDIRAAASSGTDAGTSRAYRYAGDTCCRLLNCASVSIQCRSQRKLVKRTARATA